MSMDQLRKASRHCQAENAKADALMKSVLPIGTRVIVNGEWTGRVAAYPCCDFDPICIDPDVKTGRRLHWNFVERYGWYNVELSAIELLNEPAE